jgi:hypothetical protein
MMGLKFSSFSHKMFILILGLMASVTPQTLHACFCGEFVLQAGWFWASQGKSQHIDIDGLIGSDFKVKKSHDQNALIGVGYYLNGLDWYQVTLQYGINAFYLAPMKVKGHIKQENLFNNLAYHYTRTNYPIYFATKALIHCGCDYDLVIDLGIGPNIVSTRRYHERSLDDGITNPSHPFSGKIVATFSATAGVGWRINNLFENCSLEIDYRFFYLGQGELKKVNNKVRNTLRTGTSYGNAIVVTMSI